MSSNLSNNTLASASTVTTTALTNAGNGILSVSGGTMYKSFEIDSISVRKNEIEYAAEKGCLSVKNVQLKHYKVGDWKIYWICSDCKINVGFKMALVCPSCGAGLFSTNSQIRRYIRTSPWWKFWRKEGIWEIKGK